MKKARNIVLVLLFMLLMYVIISINWYSIKTFLKKITNEKINIIGNWQSINYNIIGNGQNVKTYIITNYVFTKDDYKLKIEFYGDTLCKLKLFTIIKSGTYKIIQENEKLKNLWNIDFECLKIELEPNDQEFVYIFNNLGTSKTEWKLNEKQDVTETGLVGYINANKICPYIYDIVGFSDSHTLCFGSNPVKNNCCDEFTRPIEFYSIEYKQR